MKRIATVFLFFLLLSLSAHAAYVGQPGYRGCVIADERGQFDDTECDRIPDAFDNCPLTPNTEQLDRDSNGIGDACDLVIDEIDVQPEQPLQGRSLITTVAIMNNRAYPMRNLVVKLEVPKLGLVATEEIGILQPGERQMRDLLVRIPECAPTKPTDIVAIVEYPFAPGQKEVFSNSLRVPVASSGACATEESADKTVVDIIELQDVDPVRGAIYPFTIKNMEQESKAYILATSGLDDWGYASVSPGTVLVIPAGESRQGTLQVWANPGAFGEHSFVFSVQARDDAQQVVLLADIPEQPVAYGPTTRVQFILGVLAFLGLLVLISVVVLFARHKHKKHR